MDEHYIVTTTNTRPEALGRVLARWRVRKADYLCLHAARLIAIGRERLRLLLIKHGITFQRTTTRKESNDSDRDVELARIDYVTSHSPQRAFAFEEFGPLVIRPQAGPAGHLKADRVDYRRTITSCTESGGSTAATRSATTSSGASSGGARAPRTP